MSIDEYPPSPVPSDQRLWPGELPFTAFGQWGEDNLDLRVFDQDQWWVDRYGRPHRLEEMGSDYRRNLIAFLFVHAEGFHLGSSLRAALQGIGDQLLFGDVSGEAILGELGMPAIWDLEPGVWLESTPLMRRLRRLEGI